MKLLIGEICNIMRKSRIVTTATMIACCVVIVLTCLLIKGRVIYEYTTVTNPMLIQ